MTLVKFRPQHRQSLDPFFNAFFNGNLNAMMGADNFKSNPAVNITENDESFRLEMAAPALSKGDFDINVEEQELTISVNKEMQKEENTEKFLRREFSYQSFERSFQLPDTIDTEGIKASYENGVLNLVLPKKEEAKVKPPRAIKVA